MPPESSKSFEIRVMSTLFGIVKLSEIKYFDCIETRKRNIKLLLKDGNILKFSLSLYNCSSENILLAFKEEFPEYMI